MKKLIALGLVLIATSALAKSFEVQFGSDSDEYGGFTPSPESSGEVWSLTTNSVHYNIQTNGYDGGVRIASLLTPYTLDRSAGASNTIEGVVTLTDGYGDDNNRIGMLLFNNNATQTADGGGGLYLRLNTDDAKGIAINDGINGTSLATGGTTGSYSGAGDAWIGQTIKFTADLLFTDTGGTNLIDVTFTFTDGDLHTDTLTAQVEAADYTGIYFGFATKWRNRGDTSSNRSVPAHIDYKSFTIIDQIPVGTIMLVE